MRGKTAMSKSSPPAAEHQMLNKKLELSRAWPGKKAHEFIKFEKEK